MQRNRQSAPPSAKHRQEQLANAGIEAAVLERDAGRAIRYRSLSDKRITPFDPRLIYGEKSSSGSHT